MSLPYFNYKLVIIIIFILTSSNVLAQAAQIGKGSYATNGSFSVPPTTPYVTDDFSQKVISAKWWVTLMTTQYSLPMYAHPLSFQANAGGLDIGYPGASVAQLNGEGFFSIHSKDLTVGIEGLNAEAARVASYSHFGVTGHWKDGEKNLESTMAQGLPFVFFKITGGAAKVTFNGTPSIWYKQNGIVAATVNGKNYAIFAPTGSSWTGTTTLTSTLSGKDYLSVAVLPDNKPGTLTFFQKSAYSHVKDTRVTWNYDESQANLTTVYSVITDVKEGTENGTTFALLRHHWLSSSNHFDNYTYQSARGLMKVTTGRSFSTNMKFNGILPSMPDTGFDANNFKSMVTNEGVPNIIIGSTYNTDMGKYAQLAGLAEIAGNTAKRDAIINCLKSSLEEWFTTGGQGQFYYHKPWNRLIGYPASFGADTRMADHHFHYAYYIMAAAVIAQWNPDWAKQENWGAMVNMLIRDVNSWDDNDSLFGRFAYFEPYEGHGWADGIGFEAGTNQESSSEAMNFNAALILWGIMTDDKIIRDQGIFMYVNEARAIEQYWWDVDDVTFPSGYNHSTVGMVWCNKGAYGTWFSPDKGMIHGINFLPNTAGHLYLGRCPDYIPKNFNEGFSGQWSDLFYEFLAYSDASTAMQKYNSGTEIQGGNTRAACYLEISSLNAIGKLDTTVTGNIPSFAVFNKGSIRTYCIYNPENVDKTVTFNDGFSILVPSKKQIHKTGPIRPLSTTPLKTVTTKKLQGSTSNILLIADQRHSISGLDPKIYKTALYSISGKKICETQVRNGVTQVSNVKTGGLYLIKKYR